MLTSDLSSTEVKIIELHQDEIDERMTYTATLNQIRSIYGNTRNHPQVRSQEDMLQQRIVAPALPTGKVSTRSRIDEPRKGRLYPVSISEWTNFSADVQAFQGSNQDYDVLVGYPEFPYFVTSLRQAINNKPKKEIYEQTTLMQELR